MVTSGLRKKRVNSGVNNKKHKQKMCDLVDEITLEDQVTPFINLMWFLLLP